MKKTKMKKVVMAVVAIGIISMSSVFSSCKKTSKNTMTLYDSLGGTTMVTDPSAPSEKIEKGRLGIRSVVDSAISLLLQIQRSTSILPFYWQR